MTKNAPKLRNKDNGVADGGRFAAHNRPDGIPLTTRNPDDVFGLHALRARGEWIVLSETTRCIPITDRGVTTVIVDSEQMKLAGLRIAQIVRSFTAAERQTAAEDAANLATAGETMTILTASKDGTQVSVFEMTGSRVGEGTSIGTVRYTRDRWFNLADFNILSVEPGFGQQKVVAAHFDQKAAEVPDTYHPVVACTSSPRTSGTCTRSPSQNLNRSTADSQNMGPMP
jgi:hypothetical protein